MRLAITIVVLLLLTLAATSGLWRTEAQSPAGVLRIRVRVKADDASPLRGLARKRFFLIPGTLEQNRALIEAIERQPLLSRDCYYRKLNASAALIEWLKAGDCESVYCREIEQEFIAGPKAVPEFAVAFVKSQTAFGDETARKWLTTNLDANVREGFYKDRQTTILTLLKQATVPYQSVMTDRNGTAYFTDLEPGAYVLSNVAPAELGQTAVSWNCEVQVKQGDLATEKPYLISNRKDRLVKCVGVEKPLPACN
ncbi:MAG TPA: hypothetical protein VFR51_01680 [Pyrinomonadaceae bacterium]|nr:hypothetical protein [Pyrinomonadaceae bacterium]